MVSNQSSLMLGNVTCETDGLRVYVREPWKWRTSETGAKNTFQPVSTGFRHGCIVSRHTNLRKHRNILRLGHAAIADAKFDGMITCSLPASHIDHAGTSRKSATTAVLLVVLCTSCICSRSALAASLPMPIPVPRDQNGFCLRGSVRLKTPQPIGPKTTFCAVAACIGQVRTAFGTRSLVRPRWR